MCLGARNDVLKVGLSCTGELDTVVRAVDDASSFLRRRQCTGDVHRECLKLA